MYNTIWVIYVIGMLHMAFWGLNITETVMQRSEINNMQVYDAFRTLLYSLVLDRL